MTNNLRCLLLALAALVAAGAGTALAATDRDTLVRYRISFSNNSGGVCCSIRWFVPFLAPAYHALALYLRQKPRRRLDFCILSLWGGLLGVSMWWHGPWIQHSVTLLWTVVGAGLLAWLACRHARCPEQESIEENREMARAA